MTRRVLTYPPDSPPHPHIDMRRPASASGEQTHTTSSSDEMDIHPGLTSLALTQIPRDLQDLTENGLSPIANEQMTDAESTTSACPGGEAFPIFNSGDVRISTKLDGKEQSYQLHSFILARVSPFFREAFQSNNSKQIFVFGGQGGFPKLARQVVSNSGAIEAVPFFSNNSPPIKLEDGSETQQHTEGILLAYWNFFACCYNIAPAFPTSEIDAVLSQAERLLKVADLYDAIQLIRPYLGNVFSQYRQQLFVAIAKDPVRWLNLSLALENQSIYTEALIHLVGSHPSYSWSTKSKRLPPPILHLVSEKAKKRDELCKETELDLFLNTITQEDNRRITLAHDYESWVVVNLFRDWLSNALNDITGKFGSRKPEEVGKLYRRLSKGGDAYLAYELVLEQLKEVRHSDWLELAEDLAILKNYARDTVSDMAKNELMLNAEEYDIGYLTCAKVTDKDIPWLGLDKT